MPVLPLAFNPFLLVRFNPTGVALFPFVSSKMSSSSSSKAKVVVEYAKSGRSTCKKCSTAIAASSLRLGLVTRDSRGYDTTKWHHLQCLPLNSNAFTSTNSIGGFSSLKSSDQEKVKKLMADSSESSGKVLDEEKDSSSEKNNLLEVGLADDCHGSDLGESKTKRMKLSVSAEGDKLEIAISASDIKDKYKVLTE